MVSKQMKKACINFHLPPMHFWQRQPLVYESDGFNFGFKL